MVKKTRKIAALLDVMWSGISKANYTFKIIDMSLNSFII
jgi:hypothetical protein